ncbi:MAG TPA: c-type cytochrome [Sandaracinaceae bacterium]
MPFRRLVLSLFAALLFFGCAEPPPPGLERGAQLYGTCVPCHGEEGEGRREYGAPAIAGLDQWYVQTQLEHFRSGARGSHPDDVEGLRMRPMVQTLRSDDDLRSVAEYVASLPPANPAPMLSGGDPERGRELYATCAECHGENGTGDRERGAPNITRTSDWYLFAQLAKFKNGIRGTDPRDTTGATMRPMAMALADEQAMRDVVAYIATLPRQ